MPVCPLPCCPLSPWPGWHLTLPALPREQAPPRLDLGKKVSTPQDVMIEELSLRTNRGSQLFQQRQRRMQRFIFEYPSGYRKVGLLATPGTLAMGTGLFPSFYSLCGKAILRRAQEKVLHMSKVLNPDALAPGYSGPLKEVPPEKFNATAIPKGYRSPWQELLNEKHFPVESVNHLLMKASHGDFRNFNRTPTPFDRAQVSDTFSLPVMEFDNLSTLELMSRRPSFNRAPQGWVRILPESEEL
uniref:Myozenin 3 n=1 Tax=Nothoprocta perdicaria TaxID=30464 RepID=A0A8C6YYF7_NOTPE